MRVTEVTSAVDPAVVRERFPALRRAVEGVPCVFADAPGGTQVPEGVISAIAEYLRTSNANTGGAFVTSRETDTLIAAAREGGADLLGCRPEEVVFGPSTTALSFSLARAVARGLRPGDEIVVTHLDHDANIAPWLAAAEDTGAAVRWVDIREEDCSIDGEGLERSLGAATRVVALTGASNAVGTVTETPSLIRLVRERSPEALVVVDAVHLAPHRGIDVEALGTDVLFCSAYKFFGPHLGLMYGRQGFLRSLRPYRVRPADNDPPWAWEQGTLSHEALAGLVAAVEHLAWLGRRFGTAPDDRRGAILAGMEVVESHEARLTRRFLEEFPEVPGARLYGIWDPERHTERTPTFALRIGDLHPRRVAEILGDRGIFVWDGNYYALAIMERLGLEASGGAVRVGFCHYNTVEEVDRVLDALSSVVGGS
jgi:cysteine desulfurase family protein (TIGR01976 family)